MNRRGGGERRINLPPPSQPPFHPLTCVGVYSFPSARVNEGNNIRGAMGLIHSNTYTGRRKILCDEPVINEKNVVSVLQDALSVHLQNSAEINYLYRYYTGKQPILYRVKEIRPEICNRIVENRANEIVSFKTGYLCGEPLQYVSRGNTDEVSDGIQRLNDFMLLCGKPAKDKELAEWMYICGTGYRMIMPNTPFIERDVAPKLKSGRSDFEADEAPFDVYTLDPRSSFVVYHSDLGEKPILGVKSIARKDRRFVFSVYSATWYFEIESDSLLGKFKIVKAEKRPIKYIPIVEYPLNAARQGIFEVVLPILDAINKVQSNRIDGIEQFIQSLIVLTNAEIEEEKARWLRDAGLISLKSYGENKAEIRVIAEQLDQQQTQTLIDYLHQTILDIVGMPNRNGGSSTSDTGSAVQMRDGWETAEAMAKSDELMFKRSETEFLKIVLQIMRTTVGTALSLSDVEVKFSRRNYANLLTKAQALQTFMACGLSEEDALSIAGVGTDPIDIANRIKKTVADPKDGVAIA